MNQAKNNGGGIRYYIATALERAEDHRRLSDALNARGWTCTYDWTAHGSVQGQGAARMAEVAEAEMRGVIGADVVIVLLPGGRGTHAEMGIAIGAGIPVVLVGDASARLGADGREFSFYYAPGVVGVSSDDVETVMQGVSLAIAGGGAARPRLSPRVPRRERRPCLWPSRGPEALDGLLGPPPTHSWVLPGRGWGARWPWFCLSDV